MSFVVHCKKSPYNVYIGRPSKWGNPFTHRQDDNTLAKYIVASRDEAVEAYREWITNGDGKYLLEDLGELKGKTLGCWCKPQSCHGDVLLDLINKKFNRIFKVIIAGSRKFDNYDLLKRACDYYLQNINDDIIVVSGTANGADKLGEDYARERGYTIKQFPAYWNNLNKLPSVVKKNKNGQKYNALAGHNRNKEMAEYADALIAFKTTDSKGTENMISLASEYNLKIRIIEF